MTILRTGVDLVEIQRFEDALLRHGARFLERVYTPQELAEVGKNVASLAARFAAKEAVAKALGTGIGTVGWKEIEVSRDCNRAPGLHLTGEAARLAKDLGLTTWSLSLSHTRQYALAMVAAMGDEHILD